MGILVASLFYTLPSVVALVGVVAITALAYQELRRRHAYWAPVPLRDDEQPRAVAGDGPYRAVAQDLRLHRVPPRSVRAATLLSLGFGQLVLFVGVAAACYGAHLVLESDEDARPDQLLGKGLLVCALVGFAAGLELVRHAPDLLRGDDLARAATGRASAWSMGMGILCFAILFAVLGGALGQHEGWLCLSLLVASLSAIGVAMVLRQAGEEMPE